MAALFVLGSVTIVTAACIGAFLRLSFAIRKEDRRPRAQSLRFDAPNTSTRVARSLIGISCNGWGD